MSVPMARAFKASLDEAVAKVEEEKRYCAEQRAIDAKAANDKTAVIEKSTAEQVALVQQSLDAERLKSQQLAADIESERLVHWLWLAGGVGAGVLVGATATVGSLIYLQSQAP